MLIDTILADPASSYWLRQCVATAMARDPVDAANDAEILAQALAQYAEATLMAAEGAAVIPAARLGPQCG